MKSYQGLFAQALYLAAMPLNKEEASKIQANTCEQQRSLEEAVTEKV
ncbi:hypothetical protein JK628_03220 [Shewanella sp. KX20019]|nr:hypothetical protein [Shewanella sp. KX20019]QQX80899.1 hypothetical protein JK628_03220 [Shewanella sp. KX20019]